MTQEFTIFPAIDLRQGKVVRLSEGDPSRQTRYSDDPAETARGWLDAGAKWLHVVNLDAAFGESDTLNRVALDAFLHTADEYGRCAVRRRHTQPGDRTRNS